MNIQDYIEFWLFITVVVGLWILALCGLIVGVYIALVRIQKQLKDGTQNILTELAKIRSAIQRDFTKRGD